MCNALHLHVYWGLDWGYYVLFPYRSVGHFSQATEHPDWLRSMAYLYWALFHLTLWACLHSPFPPHHHSLPRVSPTSPFLTSLSHPHILPPPPPHTHKVLVQCCEEGRNIFCDHSDSPAAAAIMKIATDIHNNKYPKKTSRWKSYCDYTMMMWATANHVQSGCVVTLNHMCAISACIMCNN